MKNDNSNGRRNFLKTAGAVMAAASVPTTLFAKSNNLKQMIIFGGVSEPNPVLPGVFGQTCFQFQMQATVGRKGYGTISDPIFTDINSHIEFETGTRDINDIYVFRGSVVRSQSSELMGKAVTVKVRVLLGVNCDVWLTIENTPVQTLLLPAIQVIRTPIYG